MAKNAPPRDRALGGRFAPTKVAALGSAPAPGQGALGRAWSKNLPLPGLAYDNDAASDL
ncbi:hypothetical protein ACFL5O_05285 [Myxococcota bacterium]